MLTSVMGAARLQVANEEHAAPWGLIEVSHGGSGRGRAAWEREDEPFTATTAVCVASIFPMRRPRHCVPCHTLTSGRSQIGA